MEMELIDLHVHSNASDGTFAPAEVVRLAREGGLKAMALTDHDTIDGLAEAVAAGAAYGRGGHPRGRGQRPLSPAAPCISWVWTSIISNGHLDERLAVLSRPGSNAIPRSSPS